MAQVDDETKRRIDRWIKEKNSNPYGIRTRRLRGRHPPLQRGDGTVAGPLRVYLVPTPGAPEVVAGHGSRVRVGLAICCRIARKEGRDGSQRVDVDRAVGSGGRDAVGAAVDVVVACGGRGPGRGEAQAAFQPDEVLVDLRDNASSVDVSAMEAKYGIDLELNSVYSQDEKLMVAHVDPARRDALLAELRRDPEVEAAEPEARFQAFWTPNDPRFKDQWNFKLVNAEKAWDISRGRNVVVAVIDTGVAFEKDNKCYRAKDFADTKFVKGYDFINNDEHPNDDNGHGTHVAGTIAEIDEQRRGRRGAGAGSEDHAAEGALGRRLRQRGRHRGRDPLRRGPRREDDRHEPGEPLPERDHPQRLRLCPQEGLSRSSRRRGTAARRAWLPGGLAGVHRRLRRRSLRGASRRILPGASRSGSRRRAATSRRATTRASCRTRSLEATDDYYSFQGTSMASPHVAAAAALIIARGVKDPDEVRAVLRKSAKPKAPATSMAPGSWMPRRRRRVRPRRIPRRPRRRVWGSSPRSCAWGWVSRAGGACWGCRCSWGWGWPPGSSSRTG